MTTDTTPTQAIQTVDLLLRLDREVRQTGEFVGLLVPEGDGIGARYAIDAEGLRRRIFRLRLNAETIRDLAVELLELLAPSGDA